MKESDFVKKLIHAVREKYPRVYVRKLADRYTRGLPDVLIVFTAAWDDCDVVKVLFVECKAPAGKVAAIQAAEHQEIARAGGTVMVAKTVEEVLGVMASMGAVS
jgi:hypothetical protein